MFDTSSELPFGETPAALQPPAPRGQKGSQVNADPLSAAKQGLTEAVQPEALPTLALGDLAVAGPIAGDAATPLDFYTRLSEALHRARAELDIVDLTHSQVVFE